ncbi:MAG: hypothetical protein HY514_00560 [Candidatus Aenigmarchaeota archaeon]|nr:hypothetical protein [Candidatus Aenigmarchaeota archaeon]
MKMKTKILQDDLSAAAAKLIIIISVFLLLSTPAFAVSVDRNMPSVVDPSSAFTVSFTINPEGSLTAFDLADFVPNGWNLNDWSVSGYSRSDVTFDSQVRDYQGKTRNGLHWKFSKAFSSPITLAYTMTAPAATGGYEFIAVWTYPGGFNSRAASLLVATVVTEQIVPPQPSPSPTPPQEPQPIQQPLFPEQPSTNMTFAYLVVLLIIILAGAYWHYSRPRSRPRK